MENELKNNKNEIEFYEEKMGQLKNDEIVPDFCCSWWLTGGRINYFGEIL